MKALAFLFSAGLASASVKMTRQAGAFINSSDVSSLGANSAQGFNVGNFNLGDLGLGSLEVGGVNFGNVDLGNQDAVAEAILAMLGGLCLGNALSLNNILSFGFNNDVDLFFQLASLMQLEQLGFLDLDGIQSLFSAGTVLGGFNLGVFKREVAEAKKTMRRTKLRRGQKVKRQCVTGTVGSVNSVSSVTSQGTFNIATAPPAAGAGFAVSTTSGSATGLTTATATAAVSSSSTSTSVFSTATSVSPVVAVATPVASVLSATVVPAAVSEVSSVSQVVASATPVAAADSVATPGVGVAGPAATSTASAAAGGADNLADLTR